MPDSTNPSEQPSSGGVNVTGGAVNAGRDIAGRDIVNVSPGFSARAVIAIASAVGVIVFFATICSLASGLVIGGVAFSSFNRTIESTPAAASSMEAKLRALDALPAGQRFTLAFSETEISSYVRFIAGPQLGLNDARVRLLDEPGQLALRRQWNNLNLVAVFSATNGNQPLQLENAAVQILPLGDSFGWIIVTPLAQSLANQTNDLFKGATFNRVQLDTSGNQRGWTVIGTAK